MKTTEIVSIDGHQLVQLPDEYRFDMPRVAVRKEGNAVILEPIAPADWPADFFQRIRIEDPLFTRPTQGNLPEVPPLD